LNRSSLLDSRQGRLRGAWHPDFIPPIWAFPQASAAMKPLEYEVHAYRIDPEGSAARCKFEVVLDSDLVGVLRRASADPATSSGDQS
jgi:hypothetical protein